MEILWKCNIQKVFSHTVVWSQDFQLILVGSNVEMAASRKIRRPQMKTMVNCHTG